MNPIKAKIRRVFRRPRNSFFTQDNIEVIHDDRIKAEQVKLGMALQKNQKPKGKIIGLRPVFSFKNQSFQRISRRRQDWYILVKPIIEKGYSVIVKQKVEDGTPFLEVIKNKKRLTSSQLKELLKELEKEKK